MASSLNLGSTIQHSTSSTALTDLHSVNYSVACAILLENHTRWTIDSPTVVNKGGVIMMPPSAVPPNTTRLMITHKTGGTATGTYGTVVWRVPVAGSKFFILVMWSVPFNQNYYSNWLSIGITDDKTLAQSPDLFEKMYYGNPEFFHRQEYYRDSQTIRYSNSFVEVEAIMGTSHKPEVKVFVKPKDGKDLAPSTKQF